MLIKIILYWLGACISFLAFGWISKKKNQGEDCTIISCLLLAAIFPVAWMVMAFCYLVGQMES